MSAPAIIPMPDYAIGEPGQRVTIMTPQCTVIVYIAADGETRWNVIDNRAGPVAPMPE